MKHIADIVPDDVSGIIKKGTKLAGGCTTMVR